MGNRFTGRLSDLSPGVQLSPVTCPHTLTYRIDFRCGKWRCRCAGCGQQFTEGAVTRLDRLRILGPMFVAGVSMEEATRRTGYAWVTVRKYYRRLAQFSGRPVPRDHCGDHTHCPSGHPYSAGNTKRTKDGARVCRICANQQSRDFKRRKREVVVKLRRAA